MVLLMGNTMNNDKSGGTPFSHLFVSMFWGVETSTNIYWNCAYAWWSPPKGEAHGERISWDTWITSMVRAGPGRSCFLFPHSKRCIPIGSLFFSVAYGGNLCIYSRGQISMSLGWWRPHHSRHHVTRLLQEEALPKSPHFRNGYVWKWSGDYKVVLLKWTHDNKPWHFDMHFEVPYFQTSPNRLMSWFSLQCDRRHCIHPAWGREGTGGLERGPFLSSVSMERLAKLLLAMMCVYDI